MGDWDDERGRRRSALGRVDWSCWLAAAGLLFVTVISVVVQFPAIGVVTAIIAVLLVVFDSWVNRPKGARTARRDTGWSDVRRTGSRPQQAVRPPPPNRRPPPDYRTRQPARQQQPRQPQQPQRQPRVANNGQQPRFGPGQGQSQRGGFNQPGRQPPRPAINQPPHRGQPGRGVPNGQAASQGRQQRPAYRPAQPEPARGREPDHRART